MLLFCRYDLRSPLRPAAARKGFVLALPRVPRAWRSHNRDRRSRSTLGYSCAVPRTTRHSPGELFSGYEIGGWPALSDLGSLDPAIALLVHDSALHHEHHSAYCSGKVRHSIHFRLRRMPFDLPGELTRNAGLLMAANPSLDFAETELGLGWAPRGEGYRQIPAMPLLSLVDMPA